MQKKKQTLVTSYLKIRDNFAECVPEEPCLRDVNHKTGRQADDGDQNVRKGEIHDEVVGHCAHVAIFPHWKTNWEGFTTKDASKI